MRTAQKPIVPTQVFAAVCEALHAFEEANRDEYQLLREFLTTHVQRTRSRQGWLFNTNYRHEVDEPHSLIYTLISTVAANSVSTEQVNDFFRAGKVSKP